MSMRKRLTKFYSFSGGKMRRIMQGLGWICSISKI